MQKFRKSEDNITSLFGQETHMQDPVLIDLLTYWEHLRAGRIAPLRSEIDPREIRGALDHTFILEHTRFGEFRFRLAGSKLCERMGMELRGMPAYSLLAPDYRDEFTQVLDGIIADPEVVQLQLGSSTGTFGARPAQMLLLPMCNADGRINRVLGCLTSEANAFATPERFALLGRKTTRIISNQCNTPEQAAAGFAEPAAVFRPTPPNPNHTHQPLLRSFTGGNTMEPHRMRKTRPYLRLVKSD